METKCSNKKHKEIKAIYYCSECKIFICNKCVNSHSELFEDHNKFEINQDFKEIFIGSCTEKNHKNELDFFCKNHNILCCVSCISKIKCKNYGQHGDCNVCILEDIKEEKKNKLKENIKYLENISNKIEEMVNQLKLIIENVNKNKEELKLHIQKIFTKIRNIINDREDELLLEVDKKFNSEYFDEEIEKKSESIPKKIKLFLDKSKIIDDEWNKNEKLKYLINDCINIEKNIIMIDEIKKSIEKYNNKEVKIKFVPLEEGFNNFLNNIKTFGNITVDDKFIFKFRPGPNYKLSDNGLIATKINGDNFKTTIIGDKPIPKNIKSTWKIKLNSYKYIEYNWNIFIGIGPNNPNNENDFYNNCWTFLCDESCLLDKGKTINYNNHSGHLKKGDIVEVIVDREVGNISFSVNDINYGVAFTKISKEEELYPIIIIYFENDIVEIV